MGRFICFNEDSFVDDLSFKVESWTTVVVVNRNSRAPVKGALFRSPISERASFWSRRSSRCTSLAACSRARSFCFHSLCNRFYSSVYCLHCLAHSLRRCSLQRLKAMSTSLSSVQKNQKIIGEIRSHYPHCR